MRGAQQAQGQGWAWLRGADITHRVWGGSGSSGEEAVMAQVRRCQIRSLGPSRHRLESGGRVHAHPGCGQPVAHPVKTAGPGSPCSWKSNQPTFSGLDGALSFLAQVHPWVRALFTRFFFM